MAPVGTHIVALAAKQHSCPFVVLTGLHKLSPLFPHDPSVNFNEFRVRSCVFSLSKSSMSPCMPPVNFSPHDPSVNFNEFRVRSCVQSVKVPCLPVCLLSISVEPVSHEVRPLCQLGHSMALNWAGRLTHGSLTLPSHDDQSSRPVKLAHIALVSQAAWGGMYNLYISEKNLFARKLDFCQSCVCYLSC